MTPATYNITDVGFVTNPAAMTTAPGLSFLTISISGDNRDTAMEQLATNIINWVKALGPTVPCAGSHGVYVGAGTPTAIT